MDTPGITKFDLQRIIESMAESVLITDTELTSPGPYILYVNSAFEKMTGWTKNEIIGQSPRLLQGPDTEYAIFEDMREKLEKGETWNGRTINYRKDKSEFYMDWYITPIQNAGGEIYQYLAVQKEVTQLVITEKSLEMASEVVKRRSRELEKTNRKLNQLLAEQQETMSLFSKYVPEPIVKASLDKTTEKQRMSRALETVLLFCDIRGFTALIEGLNPDEVFDLLNIYYANMSEVIRRYDGVIIQFVGDEIFVAFGAPLPIENPKLRAVHCAVEMIHCLRDINGDLEKKFKREMTVGIGINYGSVMAGSLGSEDKLSYSITGSEVITAKRIESLTRGLKNAILISESVYQDVKDTMQARAWGKVDIKGQNQKVNVYQVMELI